MKPHVLFAAVAVSVLPVVQNSVRADTPSFIYETPREFFASGDFDGDGRTDMVIVDKESGKYRLGYQLSEGLLSWVDCRPTGIKGITGLGMGGLFNTNHDALAFTSPDANQITMVDVSSPLAPSKAPP